MCIAILVWEYCQKRKCGLRFRNLTWDLRLCFLLTSCPRPLYLPWLVKTDQTCSMSGNDVECRNLLHLCFAGEITFRSLSKEIAWSHLVYFFKIWPFGDDISELWLSWKMFGNSGNTTLEIQLWLKKQLDVRRRNQIPSLEYPKYPKFSSSTTTPSSASWGFLLGLVPSLWTIELLSWYSKLNTRYFAREDSPPDMYCDHYHHPKCLKAAPPIFVDRGK